MLIIYKNLSNNNKLFFFVFKNKFDENLFFILKLNTHKIQNQNN